MRVAVFGAGLVGRRTATILAKDDRVETVLLSRKREVEPLDGVTVGRGWRHRYADELDAVVLAIECEHQVAVAKQLVRSGVHVIATADGPQQIEQLWALDPLAKENDVSLIVGAAYSPGVSTVLAAYLARGLDQVATIRTAQFGTGGPACAREHHRAMGATAREVHDGRLRTSHGGTGRELVWFPEPIGAADCYRAGLADPLMLRRGFPDVDRIESRQAATRRDRLTSRLPMLRAPHAEGLVGAVWAEVRGIIDGRVEHRAMAATGAQATGAAAMAAAFCRELLAEDGERGMRAGVISPATVQNTGSLLKLLSNDMGIWAYDGSQIVTDSSETAPIQAARKWKLPSDIVAIATMFPRSVRPTGSFA